ncbi:MAG TPA: hypothetical protein VLC98_15655 [Phnomibacter sp.]|nr:hypothetical protein [Phnomibacter sp.]
MKYLLLIASSLLVILTSCGGQADSNKPIDSAYRDSLNKTKSFYPFDNWRKAYNDGLTQYTEANCNAAKKIFDELISDLAKLGKGAKEAERISLFKKAILKTNSLNDKTDGALIETGEAEQLVDLTNKIAIVCGIDPAKYGDGEGLASEWREW